MMERQEDFEPALADSLVRLSPVEKPAVLLAKQVRQFFTDIDQSKAWPAEQVVQVSVPVKHLDPVQWLRDQAQEIKLFWGARDEAFFTAAVGTADQIVGTDSVAFDELKRLVEKKLQRADGSIKYYGGMRFDAAHPGGSTWPVFGHYSFILPRFELREDGNQYKLCCNLVLPVDLQSRDRLLKEIAQLKFSGHVLSGNCPLPNARNDYPDEKNWHQVIKNALALIRNGHALEKIVLARRVVFSFSEVFDKFLLFKLLREATPGCFHFFFQPHKDKAFIGAPPERLYRRHGQSIVSEAVAGTGKRADTNERDIELGHALLLSDKDQREHAFVRKNIEKVFSNICTSMQIDDAPSLMNLNMGRHLRSKIIGELKESISDIDILYQLPPTSAVGGHPRSAALESIRALESFDRGWYAGPVGWIAKNAAEFAVAIRSGLATNHSLALYSGAGIVEGSEPGAEWGEIEQKIGDFIKALGLDQKGAKY